jgi:exosortase
VQKLAPPFKLTEVSRLRGRHFRTRVALSLLFLAALWFGLCRELSGEWSVNEQYNFGWFVPFFALYLFYLRWQDAPAAQIPNPPQRMRSNGQAFQSHIPNPAAVAIAIAALLLLLPVRLFEIANPEWRLLAWSHTAIVVTLTLLVIWWAGGKAWLYYFAFPVAFILVAVPWPTSVETPVIQGLMRVVARVAAETAMMLGTPAHVEGNLIRISNGLVGVNEACSGIRSLQTSLMIGLLFGELKRLSVFRRVELVACAIAIALFANFVRAVFLVRIAATENVSDIGRWHDIAGYSIIALVFVATMALAYLLGKVEIRTRSAGTPSGRREGREAERSGDCESNWKSEIKSDGPQSAIASGADGIGDKEGKAATGSGERAWRLTRFNRPATDAKQRPGFQSAIRLSYPTAAICWLLLVEIGTASWYRLHERNLISGIRYSVRWPEQAPNFHRLEINNEIRAVLRFDKAEAATWTANWQLDSSRPNTISCALYVFRWNPGKNSALLANLHRPDVCLPASGWSQVADDGVRSYPVNASFELPFRHFEFQRAFEGSAPQIAHAFYCLSEDRASTPSAKLARLSLGEGGRANTNSPGMFGNRSEWTRAERFRAVLEGRRHLGQQVIETIFISAEPLSSADAESYLHDLVRDVVALREANGRK